MNILTRQYAVIAVLALVVGAAVFFSLLLRPPSDTEAKTGEFEISPGEGFSRIADRLAMQGFIRSARTVKIYGLLAGYTRMMKPGIYDISSNEDAPSILRILAKGSSEIRVLIPEGASLYEIDAILSKNGVLSSGEFISYAQSKSIEGRLFPDTYKFFKKANVEDVAKKMVETFELKARPLLESDRDNFERNLILASLLEREVPDHGERRTVAGIILKRARIGMPLQIDYSVCYVKEMIARKEVPCYPLSEVDLKIKSPYNTYFQPGFPPGPIGNPGTSSIEAALNPESSPYWYYLSDPQTKKTIFSKTLDEHNANRFKYLR